MEIVIIITNAETCSKQAKHKQIQSEEVNDKKKTQDILDLGGI